MLKQIEKLCKQVGDFMLQESLNFDSSKIEIKSNNSLVSYVDLQAEKMLLEGLSKITPSAMFIAEESAQSKNILKECCWIVDPLDGTTNYCFGLPFYCISLAYLENGEILNGFIYHVSTGELYHAEKNKGSFLNEEAISCSDSKSINEGLFATGFPHGLPNDLDAYFELFRSFTLGSKGIRRLGSAALDLALVAAGKITGFYELALQPWDIAAGILLVKEAGGLVSDFNYGDVMLESGNIIASNRFVHKEMQDEISKYKDGLAI